MRKYEKKTISITGVYDFNSTEFLRRVQKSGLRIQLTINVDTRTHIFFSVYHTSFFRKNESEAKMDIIKSLIDGCSFEDSSYPEIEGKQALIHVIGLPLSGEKQIEILVSKLLDLGIRSSIFINLSPVYQPNFDAPFRVSFSLSFSYSCKDEFRRNIGIITSVIQALFDKNSISIVVDRNSKRHLKKVLWGGHVYSTILDYTHASAYFQLPLTYGIEQIKKMKFPVPNNPFTGIELGVPGEFNIGEIDKIRIEHENLFSHMAVWGASGTGKTTFLKNLLISLEKTDIKFSVIDWNNEYREIVPALNGELGKDILILNPLLGSLSINPLEIFPSNLPKEIQIWERIENFVSLMKQMFIIGEIQEAKLRQSLSNLYVISDSPTISNAITVMSENKLKSLTLKLDKFTRDFYGGIFNRKKSSLSFSDLRIKNVIIELGGLPTEVRMFFACVFLILWWDNLKINNKIPNMLVLDDFYRYANLEVIRRMLSEARKFKQGLICSHQGPYQLPAGIKEEIVRNTATKVIFRQEQTWDKHIVRDALGGLTKEQLISLSYLETGQAIIKIPSVKFPLRMDAPKPIKGRILLDHVVKQKMAGFIGEPEPYKIPITEEPLEKRFLSKIHKKQGSPLTEITKALGIKTKRGYLLKNKLIKEGLLEEERIRKGIGRPRIVLKLTKKGIDLIEADAGKSAPQYGKSEHLYIKEKISNILKNWEIKIEKGCDIKAEKNGCKVAIEIETGKSNEKKQILYNVDRDLKWADKVVIVCPNKEIKLDVMDQLQARTQEVIILTYREMDNLPMILDS